MKKFKKIFVSVGTTEFDALIHNLSNIEINRILTEKLGCETIKIQYGNGKKIDESNFKLQNILVETYSLKPSISEDILEADLVISHAGAGTCIEVLNLKKPLIVVVNDRLMDNHQSELANQLQEDGYLFCCFLSGLGETLNKFDVTELKHYEKGNGDKFIQYLDDFIGFV